MSFDMIVALVIFVVTFIIISTEIIHKLIATMLASMILILFGVMTQEKAFSYIDWNVLFLLAGMMIIVGIMKHTGVFQYIAIKTAKVAKGNPILILLLLFSITAFVSALLDNVTTILVVIPVALLISSELQISPIPFIVTQAIASNIGGTATLIGDPPNIMIGSAANLNFMDFIVHVAPVIIIIMIFSVLLAYFLFRKQFHVPEHLKQRIMQFNEHDAITDHKLLKQSLFIFGLFLAALFTQSLHHMEAATLAIFCAAVLIIIGKKHVDILLTDEIEWGTILFFMGLFMVVGSLVETGLIARATVYLMKATGGDIKITAISTIWLSGFASGVIDNIPFVATMIPIIKGMGIEYGQIHLLSQLQIAEVIKPLWWSLSLGACLGGNMTLIGASANVVSVGLAKKAGHKISFWQFTKYGIIFTLTSLVISTIYIVVRYF